MKVYLHIYNGNVQQNPLCAASCVTKDLPISLRISPTIFNRDANSVLLRAHLCTAVGSMCRTLCSKLFIRRTRRSIYTCATGMFSRRSLYAQHPVLQGIFPSLPDSRLRFFIAGQIQHSTVHSTQCTTVYTPPVPQWYEKNPTVTKVLLPIEIHVILWASGDARTHAFA